MGVNVGESDFLSWNIFVIGVEELEQRNGPSSEDSTPTYLVPESIVYNYLCSNFRLQLYFLLLDHNSYYGGRDVRRC